MQVIVVRAAYCDTPEKVIACTGKDPRALIAKHYPKATNIGASEFDHEDTDNGYFFDVFTVTK